MVSTRLMSSVSNNGGESSSGQCSSSGESSGPAKYTRNNTVIATLASNRPMSSSSDSGQCSSSSDSSGPAKYTRHNTVIATLPLSTTQNVSPDVPRPNQTIFLLNMPQEVLEKIFSFLSFKTIAHLRPVSFYINL